MPDQLDINLTWSVRDPLGITLLPDDLAPRCVVCEEKEVRVLAVYRPTRPIAIDGRNVTPDELALTGCEACGIVFSHPLPSEPELAQFYASLEGYADMNRVSQASANAADVLEHQIEGKRSTHRRERELLLPHLPLASNGEAAPRVLDFGCGLGAWLDVLDEAGWETDGFEPGPGARSIAARRHRMLEEIPTRETYDLVILYHVLEHLRDPLAAIRRLVPAIRPGGHLFVSVPDFGRVDRHRRFDYVANGLHIISYTSAGLQSLFGLAGLTMVEHFEGPDWDAPATGGKTHGTRLRCLAEKRATEPEQPERPLDPARLALGGYVAALRDKPAGTAPLAIPPRLRNGLLRLMRRARTSVGTNKG